MSGGEGISQDIETARAIGQLEGTLASFRDSMTSRLDENKAYSIKVSEKVDSGHLRLEEKIDRVAANLDELSADVEAEAKSRDQVKSFIKWFFAVTASIAATYVALAKFFKWGP